MIRTFVLPVILVALLLPACQDNGGPGDDPIPVDQFCDVWAETICDIGQTCDCLEGNPIETCVIYQRQECQDGMMGQIQAGRQTYDPEAAGHCLDQIWDIAHDCSLDDADYPSSCDTMLQGAVAENAACDGSDECLPGLECRGDVCLRMPTEGQACHPEYDCASGHYCGIDGLCHRYQGSGGPCPEGSVACGDGLYCDDRDDTCAPYLGSGESCAHASWACGDDLYCSAAAGESCRPYPGSGGDCADSYGSCASGTYCGEDELCHAQLPDGSPCTDNEQCQSYDCTSDVCTADTSSDACPF